jgi:hypothetical protein
MRNFWKQRRGSRAFVESGDNATHSAWQSSWRRKDSVALRLRTDEVSAWTSCGHFGCSGSVQGIGRITAHISAATPGWRLRRTLARGHRRERVEPRPRIPPAVRVHAEHRSKVLDYHGSRPERDDDPSSAGRVLTHLQKSSPRLNRRGLFIYPILLSACAGAGANCRLLRLQPRTKVIRIRARRHRPVAPTR